ncbi:hypothetical protein C9413_28240 [Rhizobium sp. SEMIA 4085]|uniref:hypothetical protein n=1 Tax=Rhizobium sp. SEMIA 4085 TaxID=2137761 RepID=UPI0009E3CB30|nr:MULTISPECIES: hypothetical protein [Rhizobium]NNH33172.1 hypothetical protein [Rhizobium sp. SEMIA 4085]
MKSRSGLSAPWIYVGLLAAQTAAALILFWIVFPIFHGLVTHLGERQMLDLSDQLGIVASDALLHCCYWTRLKWVPVTPPFHGPASLFIDMFVARAGMGRVGVGAVGFHGGLHAHPAARYGAAVATGAAIGAAAAPVPCYNPACGYYPYPPCY